MNRVSDNPKSLSAMTARSGKCHLKSPASERLAGDMVDCRSIEYQKAFDSARQFRLAADVPDPAEIAFSFFAHVGNKDQAIPEGVTKIGAFTRLRKGLDRFSQRQQRREAGSIVGNSRPRRSPSRSSETSSLVRGASTVSRRGRGNQRACRIGDERSQYVAGAVDAGMPAERPELSGHPFRALLFEESRRGNAAQLQVILFTHCFSRVNH